MDKVSTQIREGALVVDEVASQPEEAEEVDLVEQHPVTGKAAERQCQLVVMTLAGLQLGAAPEVHHPFYHIKLELT